MVTATLPPSEAKRLLDEFETTVERVNAGVPNVMTRGRKADILPPRAAGQILDIPLKNVQSTLDRVWGFDAPEIKIIGADERWKPGKPDVALIKTTAGDRVLKAGKPDTGQDGVINEGVSQSFYAELNLRSIRLGVDGLQRRGRR
jgi:hypothetical protein